MDVAQETKHSRKVAELLRLTEGCRFSHSLNTEEHLLNGKKG